MTSINVSGMQSSIELIQTSLSAIQKFLRLVGNESNEVDLEVKYPGETAIIKDRIKTLQKAWEQLAKKFSIKKNEILNQNNIKKFWYDITQFEIWLTKVKIGILSEDDPKSLQESEISLSKQDHILFELKKFQSEYSRILTVGERLTAAALIAEDPEYYILKQRVQDLQKNWAEITSICNNRKDLLVLSRKNFICKTISTQTDVIGSSPPASEEFKSSDLHTTKNTFPPIVEKLKETIQELEAFTPMVQISPSTTSTKLEEVICASDANNHFDSGRTGGSSNERKGIFSGRKLVKKKSNQTKKLQKSQSLLSDVSSSRKSDPSEEKTCEFTCNKNLASKDSPRQPQIFKEQKPSDHEFDIDNYDCLGSLEKSHKFENPMKFFESKKPSKLPF